MTDASSTGGAPTPFEQGLLSGFTCNLCSVAFETSERQRTHMKSPWHVFNLKRRLASLPSVSMQSFQAQEASAERDRARGSDTDDGNEHREDEELSDSDVLQQAQDGSVNNCLFCSIQSENISDNLVHMKLDHGLFIPDPNGLTNVETFVRYLATVVLNYHECLYCGVIRSTPEGIRQHMVDKSHCMLNFDREPELLEFWEASETTDEEVEEMARGEQHTQTVSNASPALAAPAFRKISDTELQLPSGAVIQSRKDALRRQLTARTTSQTAKPKVERQNLRQAPGDDDTEKSNRGSDQTVSLRSSMGLSGITLQQRAALGVMERKTQKREAVARAAENWAKERIANKQKHYRAAGPMRPNG